MKNNLNKGGFHRRNNGQGRGPRRPEGGQGEKKVTPSDGPQGFIGDGPGDGIEQIAFLIGAGFGLATGSPFVEVTIQKDKGEDIGPIRLPAEAAKALAVNLLVAAEASIHDGFLIGFLVGQVGADLDMVGALLHSFRDYRNDIFKGQKDNVLRSHGYTKDEGPGDTDPDPVPKA